MNSLPLPTDSLYKFIAIFGIILILVPIYYEERLNEIWIESVDIKAEQDILDYERDNIQKDIDSLEKETIMFCNETYDLYKENNLIDNNIKFKFVNIDDCYKFLNYIESIEDKLYDNKDNLKEIFKSNYNKATDLYSRVKEIGSLRKEKVKKNILFNAKVEKNQRLNHYISFYITITYVLRIIGFILMFIGFSLWYSKIQKYQDRNIKKYIK